MIDKQKLKEIMQFVIKEYPNGCAGYNWKNSGYIGIVEGKNDIEDCEIQNIIDECMDEFINTDLDLCGCGSPEYTIEIIRLTLIAQNQETWEDKKLSFNSICGLDKEENNNYNGIIQFVLYVLDSHKFLEHGGSICGAWLTKKGKLFLELLNMNNQIQNDNLE